MMYVTIPEGVPELSQPSWIKSQCLLLSQAQSNQHVLGRIQAQLAGDGGLLV